MTRSLTTLATVAALTLGAAAPVFAQSQLIASAGLSPQAAEGLTLNQIAAAKANHDGTSYADRQAVVIAPVAGGADRSQLAAIAGVAPGSSLNTIVAAKYNRDGTSYADRQRVGGTDVTVASRSTAAETGARSQLIASAGLSPAEAEGLTLNQIVAVKFNSDGTSYADRQRVQN